MTLANDVQFGDSNDLYEIYQMKQFDRNTDLDILRDHLKKYGYILIKNFFQKNDILNGRTTILDTLSSDFNIKEGDGQQAFSLSNYTSLTHHQSILNITESYELFNL